MENNKNEESNDDDVVTLVLRGNRLQANKKKLATHSLYFASLFSENFKDHTQNEFRINYDITLRTLRYFLNWIDNEDEHTKVVYSEKYFFFVRASLEIFLKGYFSDLRDLLELSVVFMAVKLTEHITEIIVCTRPAPDLTVEIWLQAEDLGLKVLRDVALSRCLDRFDDISNSKLVTLPVQFLLKLLLNVNARSTPDKLLSRLEEWKLRNDVPKDLPVSVLRFLNGDADYVKTVLADKKQRYVQCVVGNKLDKSLGIWSWNGKTLRQLCEMTDEQMHTTFEDNGKEMTGRQITGRGFDIYLIGGEQGIGTGIFNTALWRYCPFSKKWHIITLLPRPRRHMAVGVIDNYLCLFGGVGRHRLKLSSVHAFNVHTGAWSLSSEIPEQFTDVPPYCMANNYFIYYKSFYSMYDPYRQEWLNCDPGPQDDTSTENSEEYSMNIDEYDDPIVSLVGARITDSSADTCVVYRAVVRRNRKRTSIGKQSICWSKSLCQHKTIHTWLPEDGPSVFDQQIIDWPYLVSFACSEGQVTIETGYLRQLSEQEFSSEQQLSRDTYCRLNVYTTELKDVVPDAFKHRLGCFNLIDSESLHTLIPLPEEESISV